LAWHNKLKLDVGIKINLAKTFEVVANVHLKRLAVGSALIVEDSLCEELVCDFFLLDTVLRGVDVASCLLNQSQDCVGVV